MACQGSRARPGVRWRAAAALLLLAAAGCSPAGASRASVDVRPPACQVSSPTPHAPAPPSRRPFALPTFKGINYGSPGTADGRYLGTRWLRPGGAGWASARQALAADLDFVAG